MAAISVASALQFPSNARSQEFLEGSSGDRWSIGLGAFVGYIFGRRAGIEWGLEALGMYRLEGTGCTSKPRSGVGPLLQFALIGVRDARITLAAHGGTEFDRAWGAVTGELGATYRFGSLPGFGVHVGLTPSTFLLNASLRGQLLLDEYSLSGGIRFPGAYGPPGYCEVGRPLRTAHGLAAIEPRAHRRERRRKAEASRADGAERAGYLWERDGQHECASIAAFLELADHLLASDAPDELVERALDAACDEIRHAQLCAELAFTYLGTPLVATLPGAPSRPPLPGLSALIRLACESWLDGCLAEGAAASRAACGADEARDPRARAVQTQIATDEARHAGLGWDILRWAIERGGARVRDAVAELRHVDIAETCRADAPDSLETYGRVSAALANRIIEEHQTHCRRDLDGLLSA